MFLKESPDITNWSVSDDGFPLHIHTNPLMEFVKVSDNYLQFNYSRILPREHTCGTPRYL